MTCHSLRDFIPSCDFIRRIMSPPDRESARSWVLAAAGDLPATAIAEKYMARNKFMCKIRQVSLPLAAAFEPLGFVGKRLKIMQLAPSHRRATRAQGSRRPNGAIVPAVMCHVSWNSDETTAVSELARCHPSDLKPLGVHDT